MGSYCVSGDVTHRDPEILSARPAAYLDLQSRLRGLLTATLLETRGMALETSHGVCCTQWLRCLQDKVDHVSGANDMKVLHFFTFLVGRTAQSIDDARGSRPRSALRFQTPPLQRRTHRTPGCAPLKRRRHSPARSTCADVLGVRSSPLGADMVGKSRNMSADMLFMPGLLALMPPTICCVRSQSVRDLVTEISGGATPAPVRCGSEL